MLNCVNSSRRGLPRPPPRQPAGRIISPTPPYGLARFRLKWAVSGLNLNEFDTPGSFNMENGLQASLTLLSLLDMGYRSHFLNKQRVLPWAPSQSTHRSTPQAEQQSISATVRVKKPLRPDCKWIKHAQTQSHGSGPAARPARWQRLLLFSKWFLVEHSLIIFLKEILKGVSSIPSNTICL